jgi:serine/threonine protein phosphatase PrpC
VVDINQILLIIRDWLTSNERESSFRSIDEIDSAIGTSIGLRRTQNEDRSCLARMHFGPHNLGPIHLAVICDGLGGMEGGKESAAYALTMVVAGTFSHISKGAAPQDALLYSVEKANEEIFSHFHGNGGTTLSAAMILPDGECIGVNVGDSRIYTLKPGDSFIQLTTDDNVATEMQQFSAITPENLEQLEFGEHLTQFVGIGPDIRIRAERLELAKSTGSRLLLATDGAWRATNGSFGKVVLNAPTAINLSNWCGGIDNTTILVTGNVHEISRTQTSALQRNFANFSRLDMWTPSGHNVFYFDVSNKALPSAGSRSFHTKLQQEQVEERPPKTRKAPKAKSKKTASSKEGSPEKKEKFVQSSEKSQQFDIEILLDDFVDKDAKNTR